MNVANSISLKSFLVNLADVFDGDIEIEKTARRVRKVSQANFSTKQCPLPAQYYRYCSNPMHILSAAISLKCRLIGALHKLPIVRAKHSIQISCRIGWADNW